MDRLGGYFGAHDADEPLDDFVDEGDAVAEPPPSPVGQDERRMQVRAYNHWASLLGERHFPAIDDLEPHALDDFGPYSVLLDFTRGIEDPVVRFVGSELAEDCGEEALLAKLSDVPSRSVLSRITDHYMQILANQAPIGFEAEFVNDRGLTVLYRGILLPYSSDDATIDFIYGVINWKEMAGQAEADGLLLEIGQALGDYDAEYDGDPIETAETLTAGDAAAVNDDDDDVFDLGAALMVEDEALDDLPEPAFGLQPEPFAAAAPSRGQRGVDALGNPLGAFEHETEYDDAEGADYGDYDSGIKTAADYGLPDWDDEPEEEDVDDLVDPLAEDGSTSSLMSLVSRGDRVKKSVDLSRAEPDPAIPVAFEPEPPTITLSPPQGFGAWDDEAGETADDYAEEFAAAPVDITWANDDEASDDFAPVDEEAAAPVGAEPAPVAVAVVDEDEPTALAPAQREDAGEDLVTDVADESPEGLYDCLAAARELAQAAHTTEDRSRKALYSAVGLAYDFSLETEDDPEGFAELLEDNGLTVQERAPMTPVVKLVFGADYDKTRLTEYAAVLMHAHRLRLERGALAGFLHAAEGGLKAVVNAERRARKEEQGKPVEDDTGVRAALARKLRRLDAVALADLPAEGPEFALVMVRRTPDGQLQVIGEVPEDIPLVERAARKLLG